MKLRNNYNGILFQIERVILFHAKSNENHQKKHLIYSYMLILYAFIKLNLHQFSHRANFLIEVEIGDVTEELLH